MIKININAPTGTTTVEEKVTAQDGTVTETKTETKKDGTITKTSKETKPDGTLYVYKYDSRTKKYNLVKAEVTLLNGKTKTVKMTINVK